MTQPYVRIISGKHRNVVVDGAIFPVIRPFKAGARTKFITVDGTHLFGRSPVRINVEKLKDFTDATFEDYMTQLENADTPVAVTATTTTAETDQEIMSRISDRFDILHDMSKAACAGNIRAMIVTGPPGIGKSFGVEAVIEQATLFDLVAGRKLKCEFIKGAATPIGLYKLLHDHKDENNVLVFDDSDMLFFDDLSLNLLKSALDSGKKRKVCWNSESRILKAEDIPNSFEFKGSIIFITNLNFANIKSKKLQDHLVALESRCHYLDLTINTAREKLLRIKQIAATGELFNQYDLSKEQQDEVIEFLFANANKLREISLRTALKAADLISSFPTKWKSFAQTTIMKA